MATVFVQRGATEWAFTSSYDPGVRNILKAAGGKWNSTSWILSARLGVYALAQLQIAGHRVRIVSQPYDPTTQARADFGGKPQGNPPRPDRGQRTWADELLTAAGPELAPRLFKALAAVLHPDTGGDNQLMQQLNAARDRSK